MESVFNRPYNGRTDADSLGKNRQEKKMMMCKDTEHDSTEEKVKISPQKFKAGLKRLLSVSKEELDGRVRKDREKRRDKRKPN